MTEDQNNAPHNGNSDDIEEFLTLFERQKATPGIKWVLVVDDEPTVRRMVNRSLTSVDKEVKVYEAENGLEALKTFDEVRAEHGVDPTLIVTDLQMPIMDGWDFIDKLWEKLQLTNPASAVPLIVLSASSGAKGILFGKSVHSEKCKYHPLVTVAKEDCIKPVKYDSKGEQGLITWVKYFLRKFDGA